MPGDHLIERDRILQPEPHVGARQPAVPDEVPDRLPALRMRQAAEDGDIGLVRGQRLERRRQFVVGPALLGKP